MTDDDMENFSSLMAMSASNYHKQLEKPAVRLWWEILKPYAYAEVEKAFFAYWHSSDKFPPVAGQILERIQSARKKMHLGAAEAWAHCIRAFDEDETMVWTKEMFQAQAIAEGVWDFHYPFMAQHAFMEAYNRLILTADEPVWFVTLGNKVDRRERPIQEAIKLGRLSVDAEAKYLIAPTTLTALELIEKAGLSEQKSTILNKLRELKALPTLKENDFEQGIKDREAQRQQQEAKRQAIVGKAVEVLNTRH